LAQFGLFAALLLAGGARAAVTGSSCPDAGIDVSESDMNLEVDVPGLGMQTLDLVGPVTVLRGEPRMEGGLYVIDTEIIAMDLRGSFMGMDLVLRANPDVSSVGEVRGQNPGECFLADSFFDVFFEILIGDSEPMVNLTAFRVEAGNLKALPPLFDTYNHPPGSIPLFAKGTTGPIVATLGGEASHGPVQDPTFSIAAGGSLSPDEGHGVPTPPSVTLTRAGLGLAMGDELDALSFGQDPMDGKEWMDLIFSVDPGSEGSANSGVRQEFQSGSEESAEYISYIDNANLVIVKGDRIVNNPLTEDLDALVDQPASLVDFDGDGTPEDPVFFSLGPNSPTLAMVGATIGDVLATVGGGPPVVYATLADIGLVSGDDIDAICLLKSNYPSVDLRPGTGVPTAPRPGGLTFDHMLFSLAPSSPSLSAGGHSAADVFITNFSNNNPQVNFPLQVFAEASELGLLEDDDLNALKCQQMAVMFELSGDGDTNPDGAGGCGDELVDHGVLVDAGIGNHSGDHTQPPTTLTGEGAPPFGFFMVWTVQNPEANDYHGPYAYPGTIAGLFIPTVDPLDLFWSVPVPGADNCKVPHIHGPFGLFGWDVQGSHADPDTFACGHGIFIPGQYPIFVNPYRRSDVRVFGQDIADLINVFSRGRVSASWHRWTGPTSLSLTKCTNPSTARALLIVTGFSAAMMNITGYGPFLGLPEGAAAASPAASFAAPTPIRIGPPLRWVPPFLVPEPDANLLSMAALATLLCLRRRRVGG